MDNMSTLMSGARMLLECLAREGVDCIFGYPGVTIRFYDVLDGGPPDQPPLENRRADRRAATLCRETASGE